MIRTLVVVAMLVVTNLTPLFRAAPAPSGALAPTGAARVRYVTLRMGQLWPQRLQPGQAIRLNLFGDADYVGVVDRVTQQGGWLVWTGHLRGIPFSYFYILRMGWLCIIHVGSPHGVYEVKWVSGNIYRVIRVGATPLD